MPVGENSRRMTCGQCHEAWQSVQPQGSWRTSSPLLIASISGIEDGQARGIEYANASGEWKVGLDESRESSLGCFGYLGCS
jgi:hypothetical protein